MADNSEAGNSEWYNNSTQSSGEDTVLYLGDDVTTYDTTEGEIGATSRPQTKGTNQSSDANPFEGFKGHLNQEMAGQIWQVGKQSTQKLISTYAHIDYLRPYFDVEPKQCLNRLLYSFVPNARVGAPQDAPSELYGPTMLVFTLVAILLYGMKTSGHMVEDGTLIGTALAVCLGYWLGVSSFLSFISFLFSAHLSLLQILSLIGYSISGHCIILLISTLFDHNGLPGMFYLLWLLAGGLTAAKMTGVLISRSCSLRDGLVISGVTVSFHILSILYLRFAYHRVYEAVVIAF